MSPQSARARWLDRLPPLPAGVALGVFTWLSAALLPALHRTPHVTLIGASLLAAPPVLLALGALLSARRSSFASYCLLGGFPVALAASVSSIPTAVALSTYSPSVMLVSMLAFVAYLAAAARLCDARDTRSQVAAATPLDEVTAISPDRRRRWLGLSVLAGTFGASLVLVAFGSWATAASYRENWGERAGQGAAITAFAAGMLGTAVVVRVGQGLRLDRKRPVDRRTRTFNATLWLTFAAFVLAGYTLVESR